MFNVWSLNSSIVLKLNDITFLVICFGLRSLCNVYGKAWLNLNIVLEPSNSANSTELEFPKKLMIQNIYFTVLIVLAVYLEVSQQWHQNMWSMIHRRPCTSKCLDIWFHKLLLEHSHKLLVELWHIPLGEQIHISQLEQWHKPIIINKYN